MLYSIAGLVIDINFKYPYGRSLCRNYIYMGDEKPVFKIEVSSDMIENERKLDIYNSETGYLESLAAYRELCCKALSFGCMFIHGSALAYNNNGIIFTAPSGTGKSTQSALWRKYFGNKVVMVNDDKPILRVVDGKFFVCGTPWDGKHRLSNNIMVSLKAILLISQASDNSIEPLSKAKSLYTVLNQTIRPTQPELMNKVLDLTDLLISGVPMCHLKCNISSEAVVTAFDYIKENFNEN